MSLAPADGRLMVATPIYDGAQGPYVRSALDLALAGQARGTPVRFEFVLYEPSLMRARNLLTAKFLASDCTHLLFLDADIDFAAEDVFSMADAMNTHPECGVLGVAYPKRAINWRNVARAVETGLAKDNPDELARYAGDFPLKFLHAGQRFALNELVEMEQVGGAMMLIRRDVLETMRDRYVGIVIQPQPAERAVHALDHPIHAFFHELIEPETQALLSEDFAFCRRVRDAGFRIWLAPWVKVVHCGPAFFQGSLADVAQLFAADAAAGPV